MSSYLFSAPMCATFEYMSGGCLYEFLSNGFIGIGEKPALLKDRYNQPRVHPRATMEQLLRIAGDIALGMTYLSSVKVILVIKVCSRWMVNNCWFGGLYIQINFVFEFFLCFVFVFVVAGGGDCGVGFLVFVSLVDFVLFWFSFFSLFCVFSAFFNVFFLFIYLCSIVCLLACLFVFCLVFVFNLLFQAETDWEFW